MSVSVETRGREVLIVRAGGASLTVDRSGHGNDSSFRSVDLMTAALGTCMVGTMLSFAESAGIPVDSVRVELKPTISLDPERVKRIRAVMTIRSAVSDEQMTRLREAAESCKVHNSLHRGVETELSMTCDVEVPEGV